MGHAIHKHMNSFKASNDLKYNAIDDITQGDGAGDKGSAAYMKGEVKPDYPDIDGDGDKKESMAQAAKDKKNK